MKAISFSVVAVVSYWCHIVDKNHVYHRLTPLSVDRKSKRKNKKSKTRPSQDPGSDPDLVSTGQLPEQALKAVGVKPGTKHEGSVKSLLEGKEDIEVAGVELTKEQVNIFD